MKSSHLQSLLATSALIISPSLAATLMEPSQLKVLTYDYVIVGGMYLHLDCTLADITDIFYVAGNAGLVIANRLTENPGVTVLVLEAGVR